MSSTVYSDSDSESRDEYGGDSIKKLDKKSRLRKAGAIVGGGLAAAALAKVAYDINSLNRKDDKESQNLRIMKSQTLMIKIALRLQKVPINTLEKFQVLYRVFASFYGKNNENTKKVKSYLEYLYSKHDDKSNFILCVALSGSNNPKLTNIIDDNITFKQKMEISKLFNNFESFETNTEQETIFDDGIRSLGDVHHKAEYNMDIDFTLMLILQDFGNLQKVIYNYKSVFDKNIQFVFPKNLKSLEFKPQFEFSELYTEHNILPENLESLTLCGFNQNIENIKFPKNLKSLTFSDYEFRTSSFSERTQTTKLSFNHKIQPGTFPNTLTRLTFGANFNQEIDKQNLPPNLKYLELGDRFSIKNAEFQNLIETLKISKYSYRDLGDDDDVFKDKFYLEKFEKIIIHSIFQSKTFNIREGVGKKIKEWVKISTRTRGVTNRVKTFARGN